MTLAALLPGAFVAGMLMFLAPCTLPIVPGYLIFISGTAMQERSGARRKIMRNAVAFVLGFSVVFILFGMFAGALGGLIGPYRMYVARLAGLMLILFGLIMLGASRIPFISKEWRLKIPPALTLGKWQSSFVIGTLFAFGWSPCVGPILGTVLLLASQSATALTGGLLLCVFSLGLGVPFILTALLINQADVLFSRWGIGLDVLSKVGGLLLIVFGLILLFGAMGHIVSVAYGLFEWLGYSRLYNYL